MRDSDVALPLPLNATTGNKFWSYTTFDYAPLLLTTTHDVRLNKPAQRV
jgi:hypothetical protein